MVAAPRDHHGRRESDHDPAVLPVPAIATRLGVDRGTVYRWVREGCPVELGERRTVAPNTPFERESEIMLLRVDAVDAWRASRREPTTTEVDAATLAAEHGVHPATIHHWRSHGLPARKTRRVVDAPENPAWTPRHRTVYLFDRDDVARLLRERAERPRKPRTPRPRKRGAQFGVAIPRGWKTRIVAYCDRHGVRPAEWSREAIRRMLVACGEPDPGPEHLPGLAAGNPFRQLVDR